MNNDLISREALKEEVSKLILNWNDKTEYGQARISSYEFVLDLIDNAPTVEPRIEYGTDGQPYKLSISNGKEFERPQGEYVDISKLRLMTVEECAGHTIDYAMGWKACIEWIKKGGAE